MKDGFGLPVVLHYGNNRKPTAEQFSDVDVVNPRHSRRWRTFFYVHREASLRNGSLRRKLGFEI